MKRILVCSIARNQVANLGRWHHQLVALKKACPEWEFVISVYENDSADGTPEILREYARADRLMAPLTEIESPGVIHVKSETLGTRQYGSIWSEDRLRNLALYRNKCLEGFDLSTFDKIAYIEPDVTYDARWCAELIRAEHPRLAGIEPDVYSGWSLRTNQHPKESSFLYDTCATRQTKDCLTWDFANEQTWRNASVIRTHISDIDSNCLHQVWSTFNCFCVYRAQPFAEGLRWGHVNRRLDTGQQKVEGGWLDADTSVLCEDMRARGHGNILLNTNCLVRHI